MAERRRRASLNYPAGTQRPSGRSSDSIQPPARLQPPKPPEPPDLLQLLLLRRTLSSPPEPPDPPDPPDLGPVVYASSPVKASSGSGALSPGFFSNSFAASLCFPPAFCSYQFCSVLRWRLWFSSGRTFPPTATVSEGMLSLRADDPFDLIASVWNLPFLRLHLPHYEAVYVCLVITLNMSFIRLPLPLYEAVRLPLSLSLPLYEAVRLSLSLLLPLYEAVIRTLLPPSVRHFGDYELLYDEQEICSLNKGFVFSLVEFSKVKVFYSESLYRLYWLCVESYSQVYSFMELSDLFSAPLGGKCYFAEIVMCKSFVHLEEESKVILQCYFADRFWDLTLSRSKPSEDSLSSMRLLLLALATSSNIHIIPTLVSDSEVLTSALRSGLDMNEIAGILFDIRNPVTLFYSLSFYFVPRSLNCAAEMLAKFALYCPICWEDLF